MFPLTDNVGGDAAISYTTIYIYIHSYIDLEYFRVVFRTDVVPRLPRDDAIFQFKHVAPCHFYKSTNISEVNALNSVFANNIIVNIGDGMGSLSNFELIQHYIL